MARLNQSRSSPSMGIWRNHRKGHKNKICARRLAHSVEHLEICKKEFSHCRLSCDRKVNGSNEYSQLVEGIYQPLRERWVTLSLFCALACAQCCIWNTWGPIANSAMLAFPSWRKSLVALLSNWGCITYLTCCLLCCWLLHEKGLSTSLRMAATLSTVATFIRCVSSNEKLFTITAHTAAILNGLSGVIIGPSTALVSAVWFPRGERTTATGISSACNLLGMAASYLIGPAIVSGTDFNDDALPKNKTNLNLQKSLREKHSLPSMKQVHFFFNVDAVNVTLERMNVRVQIMSLMRIEFVVQFLIFTGVLCSLPKEPNAPDIFECPGRLGFMKSILSLIKNRSMWKLCFAAALSQGVIGPWLVMITMTFGTTVTQGEADKLAFWTVILSSFLSLAVSRLTDIFQGHLKIAIFVLLMFSSVMFFWILLLDQRVLVFHKLELYAAVILGISASCSTPALFLELAAEMAFPVSEAIVGGYLIFLSNLIGALFYFAYFIPGIGEHWSSYLIFGNLIIATIFVTYVKDEYNRTKIESDVIYSAQDVLKKVGKRTSKRIKRNGT